MTAVPVGGEWVRPSALVHVLVLSAVAALVVSVWVLVDLGGWSYYQLPLTLRGYAPLHRLLRPSGTIGQVLGMAGMGMMVVPVVYAVRKRVRWLAWAGGMPAWLNVHIFCGTVGPLLVTYHTAFKFNGAISVAYWSMVAVMLSGFVGRYLYVRIPKSIRGVELGYEEIRERATWLKQDIERAAPAVLATLDVFEHEALPADGSHSLAAYVAGQWRVRRRLRRLARELRREGVEPDLLRRVVRVESERALLLVRLTYLVRTKRLFAAWHVFHQPLVYLMFAIAAMHVAITVYLGYGVF